MRYFAKFRQVAAMILYVRCKVSGLEFVPFVHRNGKFAKPPEHPGSCRRAGLVEQSKCERDDDAEVIR